MGGAHDLFGLIDGWSGDSIPIVGYGSLLSRASIERSLGPVGEVRVARVPGYVRVFDKLCAHSLQTSAADPASTRIACCCAQRSWLGELLVSVFEIRRELGNVVFDNFMDQSFLADRTVLRRYLARESVESMRDE